MSSKDDEAAGELAKAPDRLDLLQEISQDEPGYAKYLARLNKKKLGRVKQSVKSMTNGLYAVAPIMCLGAESCIFATFCPIPPRNEFGALKVGADGEFDYGPAEDYPINQQCVLERMYMKQKTVDYIQYLEIDPRNPIELSIINELAVIDLLKNRCMMILSSGDKTGQGQDLLRTDITGYTENGAITEATGLHPVAEYIDKLERRRERWLDRLVETRRSKAEMNIKMGVVKEDSKILQQIQALRQAVLEVQEPHAIVSMDDVEILLED